LIAFVIFFNALRTRSVDFSSCWWEYKGVLLDIPAAGWGSVFFKLIPFVLFAHFFYAIFLWF
jgi:hypothetical protein